MQMKMVQAIHQRCHQYNFTISTAESCTSGLIAAALTDTPGSSKTYFGGINCYSNFSKTNIVGIQEQTIADFGAVSKETAEDLAQSTKKLFRTKIAISVTGIAGPGGGSELKPVGLVWNCIAFEDKILTWKNIHKGDRSEVRKATVSDVLRKLYDLLEKNSKQEI